MNARKTVLNTMKKLTKERYFFSIAAIAKLSRTENQFVVK